MIDYELLVLTSSWLTFLKQKTRLKTKRHVISPYKCIPRTLWSWIFCHAGL